MNSGGYLPSRFGKVNIHRYSPKLRRIIVTHAPWGDKSSNKGRVFFIFFFSVENVQVNWIFGMT